MLRLIPFIFVFIFTYSSLWASDRSTFKDTTSYALLLSNSIDDIKIYIHKGDLIKYKYEGHQFKGNLDSLTKYSLYVGGTNFRIDKLQNITILKKFNKFKKISLFFSIVSSLDLILAGGLYLYAKHTGFWMDGESEMTLAVFGLLFFEVHFLLLTGLFLLLGNLYRYNLTKAWKIESVPDVK
jgi:hypothetical protein